MIQRPQSLLLAVVAILYGVLAFAPLWTLVMDSTYITLDALKSVSMNQQGELLGSESNVYLLASCACGLILSIVTIFMFNNRPLQAKLSALNSLFAVIFVGLTVFLAHPQAMTLTTGNLEGSYEWGFYIPIAILAINFVANRLIRKDDALVKSVDRIR